MDNFMEVMLQKRFNHAMGCPINLRCAELTLMIDKCSSKDLHTLFPSLVENIFGTNGGVSWGIRNITAASPGNEFNTLVHFLGPLGPIFRLIYKILADTQVKYEYSLMHLPNNVRQFLDNGKIPPFYMDLLNIDSQTRKVQSLSLNAFDYYFFHFAYHLISPWQQRQNDNWSMWNTVYYTLSTDYMLHFLTTDLNVTILPRLVYFTGKNPTIIPPQSVTNRPQSTPKLLRTHVLQQNSPDMSTLHQPMQSHPRNEIWRSETLVQIFIDMWLNYDQFNIMDSSINLQSKMSILPSGEYIRIIRVFVKQIHAFSASGKMDATPLGELKKIVQSMLQGPMYAFLRHLLYRWPLDGSFRLILELWLSFIQPWRYIKSGSAERNIDAEIEDPNAVQTKFVDQQYLGFVAENLLAYTVIFQQLIPRFSRIDLISPKYSLMLFRVFKVFGQPNLVPMIIEIESSMDKINNSPTHSYNPLGTTLPPLAPTPCWSTNTSQSSLNSSFNTSTGSYNYQSDYPNNTIRLMAKDPMYPTTRNILLSNKWTAVVRHRMYEWEGPEFCYKPMFACSPAPEIFDLLRQIQTAEQVAIEIYRERVDRNKRNNESFFFAFLKVFSDSEDTLNDEFSMDERRKVPIFLSEARKYLAQMFTLSVDSMENTSVQNSPENNSPTKMSYPNLINVDLSPKGVWMRRKNVKYQGDPDLYPIRSDENAFLVRMLYNIAQKINSTHGLFLSNLYHREDFLGKIGREVICGPQVVYTYNKRIFNDSPPRTPTILPPRITLRPFASYTFLIYFVLGFFIARACGLGTIVYILGIFLCYMAYVITKTLCNYKESETIVNESDVTLLDNSFN